MSLLDEYSALYADAFAQTSQHLEHVKVAGKGGIFRRIRNAMRRTPTVPDDPTEAWLHHMQQAVKAEGSSSAAEKAFRAQQEELAAQAAEARSAAEATGARVVGLQRLGLDADAYDLGVKTKAERQAAEAAAEAAAKATSDAAVDAAGEAGSAPRRYGLGGAIAGGIGAGGLAVGAHQYGRAKEKELGDRNRNLAFGAGTALGVAAPGLVKNVGSTLQGLVGAPQQSRQPQYNPYGNYRG